MNHDDPWNFINTFYYAGKQSYFFFKLIERSIGKKVNILKIIGLVIIIVITLLSLWNSQIILNFISHKL